MPTLTAQTGGFAWSTAWLEAGDAWDDTYNWADVASWEANPTTPLVVAEALGAGTFAYSGNAANKLLVENVVVGNFVFNGRPITEDISEKFEAGVFAYTGNAVNELLLERIDVGDFSLSGIAANKAIRHPFGGTEYYINIEGIQYNDAWSDVAYWVDTDLWNDGDNVDIDIVERADVGSFSLAGIVPNFAISHGFDNGTFSLAGQDALKGISEIAAGEFFTVGGQAINEQISEIVDNGSFITTGQDAAKGVSENLVVGSFALAGQAAAKGLTEVLDFGSFGLVGQDAFKAISEFLGGTSYTLAGIDAILRKPRYEFDGEFATLTLLTGKDNIVSVSSSENYAILDTENNEYT